MAEYKGVMALAEVAEGKVTSTTEELLGIGRVLAQDLGEELSAALLGSGLDGIGQDLIALGADKVFLVEDPLLEPYQADSYVAVMERLCKEVSPNILLLGQTFLGRDLAPRLAFRLKTGLTVDCLDLRIDPDTKLLLRVKPVYGGNAHALTVCEAGRPQMATIRPKAMAPAVRGESRKGEVVRMAAGIGPSTLRVKVLDKVKAATEGVKLEEAEVVVSGGRGMGSAESFKNLEELAQLLSGAVGASRGAVDAGYAPPEAQVGLSGKIVTPTLYIAVGVSGAAQHLAGCSGSKNIVAINRDADAAIFKAARFGVVGTWQQVLPALITKCKELLRE